MNSAVSLTSRCSLDNYTPGKQLKYKQGPWRKSTMSVGQSNRDNRDNFLESKA